MRSLRLLIDEIMGVLAPTKVRERPPIGVEPEEELHETTYRRGDIVRDKRSGKKGRIIAAARRSVAIQVPRKKGD